jgi:hypothetical protein
MAGVKGSRAGYAAAKALAASIKDERLKLGVLFPDQSELRETRARVAALALSPVWQRSPPNS